jgi:hypothetical protein
VPLSPTRYMTIVAQDPSVKTPGGKILTARVAVPAEDLIAGPIGYRVQVVDYDATTRKFYGAHSLPNEYAREPKAWRAGDASLVDDRRFHAQNVYALVMKTLARFEFALGRRLGWSFKTHQLKVAPHGMVDANAFYSPDQEGLVFGYFEGLLSGDTVYTCLSHDVVVHETAHALIDGLREHFLDPSNPDQAAFHEGFADVVALLSVFSLPEVVKHLLRPKSATGSRATLIAREALTVDALKESALFGLADQMGPEMRGVRGEALRTSLRLEEDPALVDKPEFDEPHRRGEIFVAAVMGGFVEAWAERISESGVHGQKYYSLARVAEEGADIAEVLMTMWIRALDYMPPVHLEFGDALSAALTADTEVHPDDSRFNLRRAMQKHFALFGIKPAANARGSGMWTGAPEGLVYDRVRFDSMRSDKDEVFRFLWENRDKLEVRQGAYTEVYSVRPCTRIGADGFVLRETVCEFYQVARLTAQELASKDITAPREYLERLQALKQTRSRRLARANGNGDGTADDVPDITTPVYGGGVLIFDEYGRLKYWIHNDVFGSTQSERLEYLWNAGYLEAGEQRARYRAAQLATIHRLRALDARQIPWESW